MGTLLLLMLTGCSQAGHIKSASDAPAQGEEMDDNENVIILGPEITEREEGFSAVRFEGDDGFKDFHLLLG